jgi:hypothetical protein
MSAEKQIEVIVPVKVEDIDEAFFQLILKSKLGELIEKQISAVLDANHFPAHHAITRAVEDAVRLAVTSIAREKIAEHEQAIREHIGGLLTEKFLQEFIGKFWDKVFEGI